MRVSSGPETREAGGTVYTIRQAASLTGLPADTLRAWERRYKIPTPRRTPGGYRLYDDAEIEALLEIRRLVEAGTPPHLAAQEVATRRPGLSGERLSPEDFVAAVLDDSLSDEELSARLLAALPAGPLPGAIDDWLMPMLRVLGDAWAEGRLSPAHEHAVSAAVMRRLGVLYEQAARADDTDAVLVGLAEGDRHEIGSLCFAVLARRREVAVRYLGTDLPAAGWADAVAQHRPVAVVTAAHLPEHAAAVDDMVAAVRAVDPSLLVCVGGGYQDRVSGDVERLGHRFSAAVERFLELAATPYPGRTQRSEWA